MESLGRIFVCCYCLLFVFFAAVWYRGTGTSRRPSPLSENYLYPSNWSLVDLPKFSFVINNDVCKEDHVFLLMLVTSHPGNVHLRQAARRSLPESVLKRFQVRRVFVLATRNPLQKTYRDFKQSDIETENQKHGDIVQGNFIESYRNLTYKHLMGFQWALHFCSRAQFVLKMDDDSVVDVFQFMNFLDDIQTSKPTIIGALMSYSELRVQRGGRNKWSVSKTEYSDEFYPPFVSGWAYATTIATMRHLVDASRTISYFWIDDVYVTGILAQRVNVTFVDIRNKLTVNNEDLRCCLKNKYKNFWCWFWIGPSMDDASLISDFSNKALGCQLRNCITKLKPDFCVIADNPDVLKAKGTAVKSEVLHVQIGR